MNQKGFSLVELLVVVAIIGVLAGVGVVGYQDYVESSKRKVLYQNLDQIFKAVEFEIIVAENNLQSVIKEFDEDGDMIKRDDDGTFETTSNSSEQTLLNNDVNCNNFTHSIKEHFKDFKNPWQTDMVSITIDTDGQAWHKQGQIQLVCYKNNGGFGQGAGCRIGKSRLAMIAYGRDRGRWNVAAGNCGEDCVKVKYTSGMYFTTGAADAKEDCGWDDTSLATDDIYGAWAIQGVQTNSDAGGRCSTSTGGTPCE